MQSDTWKNVIVPMLRSIIAKWVMRGLSYGGSALLANGVNPNAAANEQIAQYVAAFGIAAIGAGIDWLQQRKDKAEVPPNAILKSEVK